MMRALPKAQPLRDLTSILSPAVIPRRAASFGCISTKLSGSISLSRGIRPVRVRVLKCQKRRPVIKTKNIRRRVFQPVQYSCAPEAQRVHRLWGIACQRKDGACQGVQLRGMAVAGRPYRADVHKLHPHVANTSTGDSLHLLKYLFRRGIGKFFFEAHGACHRPDELVVRPGVAGRFNQFFYQLDSAFR